MEAQTVEARTVEARTVKTRNVRMRMAAEIRGIQPTHGSRACAGFSLAELVVTMLVLAIVLVAALALFDFNNRLTRVQSEVADMQQSLRVAQLDMVRLIRMTGRGGLPPRVPGQLLPTGVALSVRNNVAAGSQIGTATGPEILPATDVVTIRGVFSTPLYQVNFADGATFTLLPGSSEGRIQILNVSPTGVPQDLQPLADAINGVNGQSPVAEGLYLASPLDDSIFGVVELIPGSSTVDPDDGGPPTSITVAFSYDNVGLSQQYKALNGGVFPGRLNSVAAVGLLEEHRFYIRQDFAIAGDPASDWQPKLSRARVFPGSEVPYRNDTDNWQIDIADNVFDLQVALGLDTNGDGVLAEDGTADDDWLFNSGDDRPADTGWNQVSGALPARPTSLFYLRVTTLVRTDQRDRRYQAPLLRVVEDHDYGQAPSTRFNSGPERNYRRRQLQTIIDLRNL